MKTKKSYGKEIINALRDSGVLVSSNFNYQDLSDSKKDVACKELLINGDELIACECIPGVTEFGDHLTHLYWNFPMFYVVLLRKKIHELAKNTEWLDIELALVENSEALETEATIRAGLTKQRLLMLIFSDPLEFLFQVNLAVIKYLNDIVENEIEDSLREVACH